MRTVALELEITSTSIGFGEKGVSLCGTFYPTSSWALVILSSPAAV